MENTLFQQIQDVLNKKQVRTDKDVKDLFTRAQITPIGQIQRRGVITAINHLVGKQVNRPQTEQRPQNLIEDLGVKYLTGLSSNFAYPLINGETSEWVAETEQGNVTNTVFEGLHLSPRRLLSYVEYSNEIVLNPNTDVAGAVEEDLINSVWDKVQTTMLNEIFDNTNATTMTDVDSIIAFELAASQQKINNGVYLVSPIAASKLKKVMNGNTPIYQNGMIHGFRVIETPSLEGEKVIFADFSKLLLGQWGGLDITCDNVTAQNRGVIRLIINSWWNWGKIDPNAFAFATTATTSTNA